VSAKFHDLETTRRAPAGCRRYKNKKPGSSLGGEPPGS
jgi:hypothetical protein